jgi:hypothetical protein
MDKNLAVNPIREGFHTVTPYLLIERAARLIDFLSAAFDAKIVDRKFRPDGTVMHAELRIGDSMVMLGEASSEFRPMPASILPVRARLRPGLSTSVGCRWGVSVCNQKLALRRAIRWR